MKVAYGFVSFTEVAAGAHHSYNRWHLYDHLPEQLPLDGIVWGQRWVLTPALRAAGVARPPLDRIHYITLYLLADPIQETLSQFRGLAAALRAAGRFHEQRTAHLFGPMALESTRTADASVISAEAVPFRPCRGVHVRLARVSTPGSNLPDVAGAAGAWTFVGDRLSPTRLQGMRATWSWLDADPASITAGSADQGVVFDSALATVDPNGPWDWFD